MIQFQNMRVPVVTQGLSRKGRFVPALEPSYARIDDRTVEELFLFVRGYARELKYKGVDGKDAGNWEVFFDKLPAADGNCPPHLALLMAFLELFRESQNALNQLNQKHLDYYYKTLLGLMKREPTPDRVHITVDLARDIRSFFLPEGTFFSAGKDEKGNDTIYTLVSTTQFTKAKVASVRSLYLDQNEETGAADFVKGIHGMEVWYEEQAPRTYHALGGKHLPAVEIGFAVTAPVLFLPEGARTIKLVVLMNYMGEADLEKDLDSLNLSLQDNFLIELSGESGWLTQKPNFIKLLPGQNTGELELHLQLSLGKSAPGVVPLDPEVDTSFNSKWPVIKIKLDPKGSFQYSFLKLCQLITLDIHVHVTDLKNIIIQNNQSVLDLNAPFQPFTQNPGINDDFYIGSHEIFRKNLTSLNLKMNWYHVPSTDLGKYYEAYTDTQRTNTKFKAAIEILKDKAWYSLDTATLFATENARYVKQIILNAPEFKLNEVFSGIEEEPEPDTDQEILEAGNLEIGDAEELTEFDSFDITTKRGFIRLRLLGPDFGHTAYPNLYASTVAYNNLEETTELKPLPNQPYTPELKSVSLSYSARKEIDTYTASRYFFQLHPFGRRSVDIQKDEPWLFPQLKGQGHLVVGLRDVQPLTEVSLLVQCLEGSADPESKIPAVTWSYLENNEWLEFPSAGILYDSTENLNKPGIVTLSIPYQIDLTNTILPENIFWIRASADRLASGTCRITDIQTQAALLVREMKDKTNSPANNSLPANRISRLIVSKPEIKKIHQPYPSLPGRDPEKDQDFYQRVSERLKHKQRSITAWDYERMVLEHFPEVYKVKCFHHTHPKDGFSPGDVLLIVIPDIRMYTGADVLHPSTSLQLRESIRTFLSGNSAPYINMDVQNPLFEAIELDFMVKFRQGYNNGLYEKQLQEDLQHYLAPWAYDAGQEIGLGGKIYKSAILNFIEERTYVDFVTFFKMHQYDQSGNARLNVEEAHAITPVSILTSADKHHIRVLDDEDVLCADGIGNMIIEESFTTVK